MAADPEPAPSLPADWKNAAEAVREAGFEHASEVIEEMARTIARGLPDEPVPSWATEDLRKALVAYAHDDGHEAPDVQQQLMRAIEASGLLPSPPVTATERAATICEGWWA